MVQLNPVLVFDAQKNTSTIWRKVFSEISVQMVSVLGLLVVDWPWHNVTLQFRDVQVSIKPIVTLYQVAFTPAQKQYRRGILFTHKNGDLGAISVMERSCAAPISKVESQISDRSSYYTG